MVVLGSESRQEQLDRSSERTSNNDKASDGQLWDGELPWYRAVVLWLLQLGPIPSHVAVMPDGSRRFSKRTGADLKHTYSAGTQLFSWACRWCFQAGVDNVTAFVLAARHLSRSDFEKKALFSQTIGTWVNILQRLPRVMSLGLQLKYTGQMELIPSDLRSKLAELEAATSDGTRRKTCLACTGYSSKHQIVRAALDMAKGVKAGTIRSDDITAELVEAYVTDTECPDVNMLMRTAGTRLSDFMVMQSGYAYLNMNAKMWMDVGFWDWVWAFLMYQLHWPAIFAIKKKHRSLVASQGRKTDTGRVLRQLNFIESVQAARIANTKALAYQAHDVIGRP